MALAGTFSGVYPRESPGGWQLLGRCPVPLFDATAANPVLLAPGDRIGFDVVGADRYAEIDAALRAGRLLPGSFQVAAA